MKRTGKRSPNDPRRFGRWKHGRAVKRRVHRYKREWYLANRNKAFRAMRKYHLKSAYGLTEDQFLQMVKNQNSKCAICEKEKKLCIDHDHKSGKVRGLLCYGCNAALALIEKLLPQALKYLSHYA